MENNQNVLENFTLLQVDFRGKTITCLEGISSLLNLWGLQNTNGKKKTYIANSSGKVVRIYEGTGGNCFPKVIKEKDIPDDMYLSKSK